MVYVCILCLLIVMFLFIFNTLKYIRKMSMGNMSVALFLKHQFWESGTANHFRQRMDWGFSHSQPNCWLIYKHHAIRASPLAVHTGFIAHLVWKELRNLLETWPGTSQSHTCLCTKHRKPEHAECHVSLQSLPLFLVNPSHLKVSHLLSPLGMIKLVKCMSS